MPFLYKNEIPKEIRVENIPFSNKDEIINEKCQLEIKLDVVL